MKAACQPQKAMMKGDDGRGDGRAHHQTQILQRHGLGIFKPRKPAGRRMEAAGQVTASARPNGMRKQIQAPNEVAVVVRASRMHHSHSAIRYVRRGLQP